MRKSRFTDKQVIGFIKQADAGMSVADLVRRDQEEQAKKRLCDLIEEGLASGPGRRRTKADEKELLAIARGEID